VDSLSPDEVLAEVVMPCGGFRFRVRLADGREVIAGVPKRVARLMFRIVPGDRVRVAASQTARPRILGFAAKG
jgi:translation initiation factor IF-1